MRISDWSSDVCSSDLAEFFHAKATAGRIATIARGTACFFMGHDRCSLIYAAEPRIRAQASFSGAAFLAAGFFTRAALSAAAFFFGASAFLGASPFAEGAAFASAAGSCVRVAFFFGRAVFASPKGSTARPGTVWAGRVRKDGEDS